MKLGIDVASLNQPFRTALSVCNRAGGSGVQVDAMGDLAPDRLSATGRRELRNLLTSLNQQIASFQVPLRRGIDQAENQQLRIEYICKVLALAFEVGQKVVSIPCPKLPDPEQEPERTRLLKEALQAIGRYADKIGSRLALEVGLDPIEKVGSYLDSFNLGTLAITFDPANLLLNNLEPAKEIFKTGDKLAVVHARDARRNTISRSGEETSLGNGDIEWMSLIGALIAIEYKGFLIVERLQGNNQEMDLINGVKFLKRFVMAP
jgi:L-ribulose-5-phosphate 3-epimerase